MAGQNKLYDQPKSLHFQLLPTWLIYFLRLAYVLSISLCTDQASSFTSFFEVRNGCHEVLNGLIEVNIILGYKYNGWHQQPMDNLYIREHQDLGLPVQSRNKLRVTWLLIFLTLLFGTGDFHYGKCNLCFQWLMKDCFYERFSLDEYCQKNVSIRLECFSRRLSGSFVLCFVFDLEIIGWLLTIYVCHYCTWKRKVF